MLTVLPKLAAWRVGRQRVLPLPLTYQLLWHPDYGPGICQFQGLATAKDQTPSWPGLKSGGWGSSLDEASHSLISLLERTVLSCVFCILPVGGYGLQASLAPSTMVYAYKMKTQGYSLIIPQVLWYLENLPLSFFYFSNPFKILINI